MASNTARDRPPNSRHHSPAAALASLESLQQIQRRGSITDPYLHAANKPSPSFRHHTDSLPAPAPAHDTRPSSPFVFGDATPHSSHPEPSSQLRKILHSPSSDHLVPRHPRSQSGNSPSKDHSLVQHDSDRLPYARPSIRDNPPAFDFSMRRHSIAVGQNPITLPNLSSTLHGTKRKMSTDRSVFAPVGEDPDTHLVGPGMPSVMDVDVDAPAPKRRGSTIDTQRIAQLSLNDRRNSVDSRGAHWMLNDRRDSAPSLFPSVPGINSFNSSDSHHSRVSSSIASFSWPANEGPNSSSLQNESNYSNRTFDPVHELSVPPPTSYAPDRRMSVPDNLTHPSSRSGHSRSRPPSRQNTDANSHSGLSSGQEEPSGTSSPNTAVKGKDRDTGLTPYSRSPELRVSHKLAERKRRKEMKELFDELRAQLPADRGMKASKWEILSKAIDFVAQLKQSHQEMAAENSMLRQQLHAQRSESFNSGAGPSSHNNAYGQPILPPFPPPLIQPHQTSQNQSGHPDSRPNSSQTPFPPLNSSSQNGRGDSHPT